VFLVSKYFRNLSKAWISVPLLDCFQCDLWKLYKGPRALSVQFFSSFSNKRHILLAEAALGKDAQPMRTYLCLNELI
jgi:hypothetical protein